MKIISSKAIKNGILLLWLTFGMHLTSNGQGCNCPPAASCGPCNSGFTSITLRYNGAFTVSITANDGSGLIFTDLFVNTGEIFTLEGSMGNGKFNGNTLSVYVTLIHNFTINTNCITPLAVNQTIGSFTVMAAESYAGGPLCCSPGDIETVDPVITGCPSDYQVSNDAGACTASVSWPAPTANDNCGVVSLTSTHSPGFNFPVGSTEVIYTATDDYGNAATCSFDVVVTDDEDPVISGCLSDIFLSAGATCEAVATWTPLTASDNCTVSTFVSSHIPGETFTKGTTPVVYTATDPAGNTATCTFNVIVVDEIDPSISGCPVADINVIANGSCEAVASWTAPIATDNCGLVTLASTHSPGDTFPIGTTTVIYTATDESGNISTCSFDVNVSDDSDPIISGCPSADILAVADGSCQATVNWTAPVVSDNCTIASWISSHNPGDIFDKGTTLVTYTATDGAGNISTCTFNIIVTDETGPVFSGCPVTDITVTTNALCQGTASWVAPSVTDNCGPVTATSNYSPGNVFSLGTTVVIYTAEDAAGNVSTCQFNVVVQDNADPEILDCPSADIIASADESCQAFVNWAAPTASDNCSLASFTSSHSPGDAFPLGTTVVIYTATDGSGNIATCAFNVVVNDDTDPIISGCISSDIVVPANLSCQGIAFWTEPVATDNCALVPLLRSHAPGSTFPLGTTPVTYTATDGFGNISTCAFNVIVEDVTSPVISGCFGTDIIVVAGPSCEGVANWVAPTATDNCGVTLSSTHDPGDTFPFGRTPVTYTAEDVAGNIATCTFDVVVVDQTAPVFSGCVLSDIQVFTDGSCEATANWAPPSVADNCSVPVISSTHSPGEIFPLGTTTVKYTATDGAGNIATCEFDVVVVDNTPPVISGCNTSDIPAVADGNCGATVNWVIPTSTDNCGVPSLISSHDPGDTFPVGTTIVTYTATDNAGNISTCTFKVIVSDNTPPTISGCIVDDILLNANSSCQAIGWWTAPTANDNCGIQTFSSTHSPGGTFDVGTTLVKYTAMDLSGNIAECSFNVIVKDGVDPVILNCPNADIVLDADASCQAVAYWTSPSASDNCVNVTLTSSHEPGDIFPKGTSQVIYTATDESGNTSSCSFNVIVNDTVDPVLSGCFASDIIAIANSSCQAPVNWEEPMASDNCGSVNTISSHRPGDVFPLGRTTVTYRATDTSGNSSECSFDVVVIDSTPAEISSCSDLIVEASPTSCETSVSWSPPTMVDCSPLTVVSSHAPGDLFSSGTTDVTYTATDSYGNVSSCTFKVIVQDKTAPVFQNCVNNITVNAGALCEATVNWVVPEVNENCDIYTLQSTHAPGTEFPLGVTKVIYTAADALGNTSVCEFTVTVKNETKPVFQDCPQDIFLTGDEFGKAVGEWSLPTATSACGEVSVTSSHRSGDQFSIGSTKVEYNANDISGNTASCSFAVVVKKQEIDIGITKVVTPDGNGINDEWVLTNIEKFSRNEIVIVDRWGSIIYSASGYNNDNVVWRGTRQDGGAVPTGTYFYRLTVRYGEDSLEKTGFVELIR